MIATCNDVWKKKQTQICDIEVTALKHGLFRLFKNILVLWSYDFTISKYAHKGLILIHFFHPSVVLTSPTALAFVQFCTKY